VVQDPAQRLERVCWIWPFALVALEDEEVNVLYIVSGCVPFVRTSQPAMRMLGLEVLAILEELPHIIRDLSGDGPPVLGRLDVAEELLEVDRVSSFFSFPAMTCRQG
jgi:hypothetical protein